MNKPTLLILGSQGMLGDCIYKYFVGQGYNCIGTSTSGNNGTVKFVIDNESKYIGTLCKLLEDHGITHIFNAIGTLRFNGEDPDDIRKALYTNSIFPKNLTTISEQYAIKTVHMSSNGVFAGMGPFADNIIPTPNSIYGISKYLGDISTSKNTIIRTSIIGIDLMKEEGLLSWFLSRPAGTMVEGYTGVLWNGMTTLTIAKIVEKIWFSNEFTLQNHILQLAGRPYSKFDLLKIFREIFNKNDCSIAPISTKIENLTLVASKEQLYFMELITPIEIQLKELKEFYNNNGL